MPPRNRVLPEFPTSPIRAARESVGDDKPERRSSFSRNCPITSFLCPISGRLFHDPVVTADGHSYEKQEIDKWFKMGSSNSPMTGLRLPHTHTVKNHTLRAALHEYIAKLKDEEKEGPLAEVPW